MTSQTDDFLMQRAKLWDEIHALFARKNVFSAREAQQLLVQWMRQHPDDVYSQEGGEQVFMMAEAWEIMEGEEAPTRTEEFYVQRAHLLYSVHFLLGQMELRAVQQARQLLQEWLRRHPDDSYSREVGQSIDSMEKTLTAPARVRSSEPVAA